MSLHKLIHSHPKNRVLHSLIRNASVGMSDFKEDELTPKLKHDIERHWRHQLVDKKFNPSNVNDKFYVLSMFPYPSGQLHMGHVRVYAISDAMARFYRMNGKNVLQPMGWDAFGLPAENAAIQRNIPADVWTKQNIAQMKGQLMDLGCSFDWDRELATCDPTYYKWTQSLFLKLFNAGLAYQKEDLVNWDPVDKTVLANEQVDEKGNSWRSGAKVEKKWLRQWFIKTTKFSKSLYDGLDNPILDDWQDIIKIQKNWIGECDGVAFELATDNGSVVSVWTKTPEHFGSAAFIAISKEHALNVDKVSEGILNFRVINPFNGKSLPVIATNEEKHLQHGDTYLGFPSTNEFDKQFADRHKIEIPSDSEQNLDQQREEILSKAQSLNIGGYACGPTLKDWLISRQRKWGTPIPIIHCDDCGPVPVDEADLPVVHSMVTNVDKTECPKCKNPNARRESDTMDTFVDSSWYFLRYLDPKNDKEICEKHLARAMPVDLYIGGKEHALLHLYYARFMNHFLHSIGLVPQPEPFKRLFVQGMVKSQSYRVKSTGKYLAKSEVKIDEKKNKAEELSTGEAVEIRWDKMSKSKLNGVDPAEIIAEHSTDSVRLITLADVTPTGDTNWPPAAFVGILNWQRRLWLTLNQFYKIRSDDSIAQVDTSGASFLENEAKLLEARNFYIAGTTFNYRYSHQLSLAVSRMLTLTKSIRAAPKEVMKYSGQYERALAAQIKMIAPMAPHFASELWSQFARAPNRINASTNEINWDLDVLDQSWPKIDAHFPLALIFKVNGTPKKVLKFTAAEFKKIDLKLALQWALEMPEVQKWNDLLQMELSSYVYYPYCHGVLDLFTIPTAKEKVKDGVAC